jgi:hypothetical protein
MYPPYFATNDSEGWSAMAVIDATYEPELSPPRCFAS